MITYYGREWLAACKARLNQHLANPRTPQRRLEGTFSCPFSMMARVNKQEISPTRALVSPDYQVEGRMLMMARLLPAISTWAEVNASIACSYNFRRTDDDGNALR